MLAKMRDVVVGAALVATGVVLAPVAGHAAGTLMTLVDSNSTVQAQVDGAGSLRVGDGTGPMTVDGTVRTTSSDGAVLLLNRVIPATSSGAVAAAATTTITQYRHQRMYVYSRCTATSGACDTAEVWAHVGTTNALLLALPVFSFPGPNAGGQTPTATKSNDYIADRLTFFVRRGSNTDLAAPQITIVVYGVK